MQRCLLVATAWTLGAGCMFMMGCGGGDSEVAPPPPQPVCTAPVTVSATRDTIPVFSWSPDCKIGRLLVEHGFDEYWGTEACGENIYTSPIVYGINPPGTCPEEPATPLVPGLTYSVRVFRFVTVMPESIDLVGEHFFTCPFPDSIRAPSP